MSLRNQSRVFSHSGFVGGELPYGQTLRISGLRIFGLGHGEPPAQAQAVAERTGPMNGLIRWQSIPGAQGCNIRYGIAPDKVTGNNGLGDFLYRFIILLLDTFNYEYSRICAGLSYTSL